MLGKLTARKILSVFLAVSFLLFAAGCGEKGGTARSEGSEIPKSKDGHPKVQIEMEDGGKMVLELYPEYAPKTVENFVNLVEAGFYDGSKFHRIIKGFMVQGGAPKGDETAKTIKGEFASNGFKKNTLKHTRGVISMARVGGKPDSASSQFFIMDGTAEHLDGDYAAFGKLIEGEDVLDKIANTPVSQGPYESVPSVPKEEVVMKKVTLLER